MSWYEVFRLSGRVVMQRHELGAAGATDRSLAAAIAGGYLMRVRRGYYALPTATPHLIQAVRVGGRLGCISALRHVGVFGFDHRNAHIQLDRQASRVRGPLRGAGPLNHTNRSGATLHWATLVQPTTDFWVGVLDALAQAVKCQEPRFAIASIDSALFLGKLQRSELGTLFDLVGDRYQWMRAEVDGRSEAGQESVLAYAFRRAGISFEIQVNIAGVGRVDFVLEGRLVVEADSRQAHDGWEIHVRDRDRDINLARQGLMSLRPAYKRIMYTPQEVVEAALNLLAATDRFRRVL